MCFLLVEVFYGHMYQTLFFFSLCTNCSLFFFSFFKMLNSSSRRSESIQFASYSSTVYFCLLNIVDVMNVAKVCGLQNLYFALRLMLCAVFSISLWINQLFVSLRFSKSHLLKGWPHIFTKTQDTHSCMVGLCEPVVQPPLPVTTIFRGSWYALVYDTQKPEQKSFCSMYW